MCICLTHTYWVPKCKTPCLLSPTRFRKPFLFLDSLSIMGTEILKKPIIYKLLLRGSLYHISPPIPTDLVSGPLQLPLAFSGWCSTDSVLSVFMAGRRGGSGPLSGAQEANSGFDLGPRQPHFPAFLCVVWPFRTDTWGKHVPFSSCKFNSTCAPSQRGRKRARTN